MCIEDIVVLGGGQNLERPNVENRYSGSLKFGILDVRKIFLIFNFFFDFDICLNYSNIQNIS